jgi:hypothetical protein
MEEAKITIKEEEQENILDFYQKIEDLRSKLAFVTFAMTSTLSERGLGEDLVGGFQLIMFSLEDELKQIDSIAITLLGNQQNFESAESRIKAGFIKTLNEDVDIVKKYIEHINKMKMRAEDVLLIKYQKAKNRE